MCTKIFVHSNFILGSDSDKTNTRVLYIEFKSKFVASSHLNFSYTHIGKVITLLLYLNDR